jgi:hypothetical protein
VPDSGTYLSKVRGYLTWLTDAGAQGDPLAQPRARDWAVRDYRTHLLTVAKRAPATINKGWFRNTAERGRVLASLLVRGG